VYGEKGGGERVGEARGKEGGIRGKGGGEGEEGVFLTGIGTFWNLDCPVSG